MAKIMVNHSQKTTKAFATDGIRAKTKATKIFATDAITGQTKTVANHNQKKTAKIFGTDGIRGHANSHPITGNEILNLARAVGSFAQNNHKNSSASTRIIIGKDTRLSGYMLEPALTAGFISTGCNVILLGPLPTPAVAMLTKSLRADIGIMISASHNPYNDNGIKIFNADGLKLSAEQEAIIESLMQDERQLIKAKDEFLGRAKRLESARGRYVEYVKATFPQGLRLDGLKIIVDCANGAAYRIAPDILYELGAEIIPVGVEPDGCNINKNCGALATEAMQQAVIEHNADLGIALDGDADRVIMCDKLGRLLNGDKILGIIADYYQQKGFLQNAVVGTVMANVALEEYLADKNIPFIRTPVGDKNITSAMLARHCNLGGEQSGHIIVGNYGYVGDGLLASLQVLAACLFKNCDLSHCYDIFTEVPQRIVNMRFSNMDLLTQFSSAIDDVSSEAALRLQGEGRVLIRPSGTEPVLRLMVEARDKKLLDEILSFLQIQITNIIK